MPAVYYRLTANVLCHDVRLNSEVETAVALDHSPTEAEAERLLYPVADALVSEYGCQGCAYQLSNIQVSRVESD